jgi:hypothetical protein
MFIGNEILVYFAFLASFSGSTSISSLSKESLLSLPLSVSASEIETLLGSLPVSEGHATVLFFFFFLERVPLPAAC